MAQATAPSADWTTERTTSLLDFCYNEMIENPGSRGDNSGFKAQAWTQILNAFNETNHLQYTKNQLSSKFSDLKKEFSIFESLKNKSGFGWNPLTKAICADPQSWDALIQSDKKFAKYRYKSIENYDTLVALFDGKIATGRYSSSSTGPIVRGPTPQITPTHHGEDPELDDEPMVYDEESGGNIPVRIAEARAAGYDINDENILRALMPVRPPEAGPVPIRVPAPRPPVPRTPVGQVAPAVQQAPPRPGAPRAKK